MDSAEMSNLGKFLMRTGNTMCHMGMAMMIAGVTCAALSHGSTHISATCIGCMTFAVFVALAVNT